MIEQGQSEGEGAATTSTAPQSSVTAGGSAAPSSPDASVLGGGGAPAGSLRLSGSAPPACSRSPPVTTPSPSPHPNPASQGPACRLSILLLGGQGPPLHPGGPCLAPPSEGPCLALPLLPAGADSGELRAKPPTAHPPTVLGPVKAEWRFVQLGSGSQEPSSTRPSPPGPCTDTPTATCERLREKVPLRRVEGAAGPRSSGPETGRALCPGTLRHEPTRRQWGVS